MKKRTYLIALVLLLLACGGGWLMVRLGYAADENLALGMPLESSCLPTVAMEEVCLPAEECLPGTEGMAKVLTLQEEIALLNQPQGIPFLNTFMDGHVVPMPSPRASILQTRLGYTVKLEGESFLCTPTYSDGVLYTSGGFTSTDFYALDAATGKIRWAVNLSDDGPSSALVLDSIILFNTESCTIFALDRFTGAQVWSKWIGDPLMSHPVSNGKLVFTAYPNMMGELTSEKAQQIKQLKPSHPFAAMDVKTGEVVWQRWLDGDVMTTPVLDGNEIYLTTFAGTLYKLSAVNGKILKARHLQLTSLPTVAGGSIFSTQRKVLNGKVHEAIVEIDKGSLALKRTLMTREAPYLSASAQKASRYRNQCEKWDADNGFFDMPAQSGYRQARALVGQTNVSSLQNFVGSTVVIDSTRLYSCMGDALVGLDIATGDTLWTHPLAGDLGADGGHFATMPIVADKYVISCTIAGEVLILNKADGSLRKSYTTGKEVRNQPIVVKGKVFLTSTKGELACVDTQNRNLDGWPMFLQNNAHHCGLD